MIYCINPLCQKRENSEDANICSSCGTSLLIHDRFRLIRLLRTLDVEKGTEIFEIIDEKSGKSKTHKVLKILSSDKPDKIKAIERESEILTLLRYPGGIPLVNPEDYFIINLDNYNVKLRCLVMQKFEGQDLENWVRFHAPITQKKALNWLQQLFEILDFIHTADILHRDIKPSNIILQPNGKLALIDFGAIRKSNDRQEKTGSSQNLTRVISSGYTSPEQLEGMVSPPSDFFSLGRTFVYLLTREQPSKLINKDTRELEWRSKTESIEEPLLSFIDGLITFAPGKRPKDAKDVLERLKQLPQQIRRKRLLKSKEFGIGAVVVSLLLGFGIYEISLPWIGNQFFSQGVKAQTANRAKDAEKDFQLAVQFYPKLSSSISEFYFQQVNRSQNPPELARKLYEQAIYYNPNDADAYNNLGLVCDDLNDFSCMKASYKRAAELKHNKWELHYNLGAFYDDQGDYRKAEEEYNEAKEPDKELAPQASNSLARLDNLKGDYDGAIPLAKQALTRTNDPDLQASIYKNLGWAFLEKASVFQSQGQTLLAQKQYEDAKNNLWKALRLDLNRGDTYCLLAQVEEALNNPDAITNWDTCLRMGSSPTQPEIEQWKKQVLQRLSQK